MNKANEIPIHPASESEEAAILKTEEYKLDSYFLSVNAHKRLYKKFDELEQDFIEIINNVPAYYPTIFELCNLYGETGNRYKYKEMLDYAIKKFPHDEFFLIMNARYHYDSKDFASARKALEALASDGVRPPIVMKLLGNVYLNFKQKTPAIEVFRQYLSEIGEDREIRMELIRLYFESGDFINAMLELKHIAEKERDAELKKIEAICYYYKEDYKKSLELFSSIYRHFSDDIFTLMYLGDICFRLKKNYRGEYYWERALKIDPKSAEERAYLARINLFINEYERAYAFIDFNFKKFPNHYLSIFMMGLICLCEDKYHLAAAHWLKVYAQKRDMFIFEFEMIKKTLKLERIKEFVVKVSEAEYNELRDYIKQRCDIK